MTRKIKFKMGEGCFNAANQASGGVLAREGIEAAFQRIDEVY